MANTRIGSSGTTLTERTDSPSIQKSANGARITHSYDVNYADAETALAGYSWGGAHAAPYAESKLREMEIEKNGPKNAIVRLVYYPDDWQTGIQEHPPAVGTIVKEVDSHVIEVPIGQHPNASSSNYDEARNIGIEDWAGIKAYLDPRPIYRRIETLDSFVFSEANAIANVAKRFSAAQMAAVGLSAATTDYWLKTKLAVRSAGGTVEKTDEWQYSLLWHVDLYGPAE